MIPDLPKIDPSRPRPIEPAQCAGPGDPGPPPRILVLHGSVRPRSYSRGAGDQAERLLRWFGAEVRRFDPSGLPLSDDADAVHPKAQELRDLAIWSEGMVWSSPERHGAMSATIKAQIDRIPLSTGRVRPTQGKALAPAQVCGGRRASTRSNSCAFSGAGCAWSRSRAGPRRPARGTSSIRNSGCDRRRSACGSSTSAWSSRNSPG